jgi:hypothetical protein
MQPLQLQSIQITYLFRNVPLCLFESTEHGSLGLLTCFSGEHQLSFVCDVPKPPASSCLPPQW